MKNFWSKIKKQSINNYKWNNIKTALKEKWYRYQINRALIAFVLFLIFTVSTMLIIETKMTNVKNLQASMINTTTIYDNQGNQAGVLQGQKGTYVSYNEINQNMRDAVLSIEDRNFYKEPGFSITGIIRAFFTNIKNKLTGANGASSGGSTLTQQLVKNAYLSQEQTLTRKIKELFLSMQVEMTYSKNQIFNMYLNHAWFGNGVWGVEDAAEKYFGVHASDLTTSQAATLAGMLTAPSIYDPYKNPEKALARRNLVLQTMYENKKLSKDQLEVAKSAKMILDDNYNDKNAYKYPWYFDAVINEAINKYHLEESKVLNGGYKIYTNLNQKNQTSLQNDYENDNLFPVKNAQAASIVLDSKTGGVLALVGGRGQHIYRGFNRATQAKRQPGSAIKPLVVYAPALASGYSVDSKLPNKKMPFGTNNYEPNNALNYESDDVPMYIALAKSYNIPAVYLMNKLGVDVGYSYAKKFDLPVTKNDKNLALALGGLSIGVSPLQLAQAYTAFANNGTMSQAYFITKIVDPNGKVIVDNKPKQKRVISESVANKMTSMMLATYTIGTGVADKPSNYQVAGKTGTTESVNNADDPYSSKDSWVVGYTKDIVAVSWMGFDKDVEGKVLPIYQWNTLAPLAKAYMTQIIPTTAMTKFNVKNLGTEDQETAESVNDSFDNIKKQAENAWNDVSKNISDGVKNAIDNLKSWLGQ